MPMQLPDESVEYHFHRLLAPPTDGWTPLAELAAAHLLPADGIEPLRTRLNSVRSQVAAEREMENPPAKLLPLLPGFIDLPQQLLDGFRRKGDASDLGRVNRLAARLRESCDRVVVLSAAGPAAAARGLFDALCHAHHNELPAKMRMGKPRVYFDGDNLDNDALQELLELLENTCVDPDLAEERWGVAVVSPAGDTLETAAAYRAVKAEAAKFYGPKSDRVRDLLVGVTAASSRLRDLMKADGHPDDDILTVPDNVGGRFAAFTPAGLLPAAVMGLDIRALLLGAAAMTKRFLEDPFDKNPVLQLAAVNHLMADQYGKPVRVLAVWTRKLEALGRWYDQLVSEALGKGGKGPTPVTAVYTRDAHGRGQLLQEGGRDKLVTHLYVRTPRHPAVLVGMNDRNEDDLNGFSRKGFPDLLDAAFAAANRGLQDAARPAADLVLPALAEHAIGQLMQLLMLATVVEARLADVNPYAETGTDTYKRNLLAALRATPNLPKGEVRDAGKRPPTEKDITI